MCLITGILPSRAAVASVFSLHHKPERKQRASSLKSEFAEQSIRPLFVLIRFDREPADDDRAVEREGSNSRKLHSSLSRDQKIWWLAFVSRARPDCQRSPRRGSGLSASPTARGRLLTTPFSRTLFGLLLRAPARTLLRRNDFFRLWPRLLMNNSGNTVCLMVDKGTSCYDALH